MAYDKLVDSSQLNSDLGDVADAIRAKSGGSSQLAFPSGFISEIGNISTGGGGGLPPSISALDGGSFTLASDTRSDTYTIPTSLDFAPNGFVVWSDGEFYDTDKTSTSLFVMLATVSRLTFANASSSYNGVFAIQYYRYSDKRTGVNNGNRTEAQMANYLAADNIKLNDSSHYYESGKTYKWLAWA